MKMNKQTLRKVIREVFEGQLDLKDYKVINKYLALIREDLDSFSNDIDISVRSMYDFERLRHGIAEFYNYLDAIRTNVSELESKLAEYRLEIDDHYNESDNEL